MCTGLFTTHDLGMALMDAIDAERTNVRQSDGVLQFEWPRIQETINNNDLEELETGRSTILL